MKQKMYASLIALSVFTACSNKDSISTQQFKVNEESSFISWKGSATTHSHEGGFKVSGNLQTNGKGNITGGEFTIPIASISNIDLTNPAERDALLNHLKSPDFFNIALHPDAHFHITGVAPYKGNGSSATTVITGDFTMIGQTHSIEVPATIKTEKDKITAEGSFKLNRFKWGMNSYNDPAQALYILPDIDITLNLHFTKSRS